MSTPKVGDVIRVKQGGMFEPVTEHEALVVDVPGELLFSYTVLIDGERRSVFPEQLVKAPC